MKQVLYTVFLLVGCGIADAVDTADNQIAEYNKREAELKQQLADKQAYFQCWVMRYDLCLADALNAVTLCNYEQTQVEMALCEQKANKECTNGSN